VTTTRLHAAFDGVGSRCRERDRRSPRRVRCRRYLARHSGRHDEHLLLKPRSSSTSAWRSRWPSWPPDTDRLVSNQQPRKMPPSGGICFCGRALDRRIWKREGGDEVCGARWTRVTSPRMFRRRSPSQKASREESSCGNPRPMRSLQAPPSESFRPLSVATGRLPPRRRATRALRGVSRSEAAA